MKKVREVQSEGHGAVRARMAGGKQRTALKMTSINNDRSETKVAKTECKERKYYMLQEKSHKQSQGICICFCF